MLKDKGIYSSRFRDKTLIQWCSAHKMLNFKFPLSLGYKFHFLNIFNSKHIKENCFLVATIRN